MKLTFAVPLLASLACAIEMATPKPTGTGSVAFGIGVSNFTRSLDFYTKVIGLTNTGLEIPTPWFDETILSTAKGSAFLLMSFKPPRPTANLPIKLVFSVPDVKAMIDKLKALGHKIVFDYVPGSPFALAEDPDGYLLEFNPYD